MFPAVHLWHVLQVLEKRLEYVKNVLNMSEANILVVACMTAAWNCRFSINDFTPFVALSFLWS